MQNNLTFSDFLRDAFRRFDLCGLKSGLVSLCLEIPSFNLIDTYEYFIDKYSFSAFWEENEKMSYIALDKCKYINLNGPKKFELAEKFNKENFKNLVDLNPHSDESSLTKAIYFFSFSENCKKNNQAEEVPDMEAVIPKVLLIKSKDKSWLRINCQVNSKSSLRENLEEFWAIRNQILHKRNYSSEKFLHKHNIREFYQEIELTNKILEKNINKAIQLVEEEIIQKIVVGTRIIISAKDKLNVSAILKKLKIFHPNTCRYVWKRNDNDITFGASPEKLFSFNNQILILEAIAGTESSAKNSDKLLKSSKNLREHNFVSKYLIDSLNSLKIENYKKEKLEVKSFGNLSHLRTIISSKIKNICPFELLNKLHPSPAVCGYPQTEALHWIYTLESFSRGNYASPIGWVDSSGNADFRVAIRGIRYINKELELIAGAGIVKGSKCNKEIDEIKLKLESIAQLIFNTPYSNESSNFSITRSETF